MKCKECEKKYIKYKTKYKNLKAKLKLLQQENRILCSNKTNLLPTVRPYHYRMIDYNDIVKYNIDISVVSNTSKSNIGSTTRSTFVFLSRNYPQYLFCSSSDLQIYNVTQNKIYYRNLSETEINYTNIQIIEDPIKVFNHNLINFEM